MLFITSLRRCLCTAYAKHKICRYGTGLRVNRFSKFTSRTYIGDNCHFNGMRISGKGDVSIGDNFHSGENCRIITQNHNYEGDALPYDNTFELKPVSIGKNVWFGDSVIILPGTIIGDGAILQAGSVVHGVIPPLAIGGGNPAHVFKYRDKEHYYRLEKEHRYN